MVILGGGRTEEVRPEAGRTGAENERYAEYARTLSWFQAKEIALGVDLFRSAALDDSLLRPEEAKGWISGRLEAAARKHGVPVTPLVAVEKSKHIDHTERHRLIEIHDVGDDRSSIRGT